MRLQIRRGAKVIKVLASGGIFSRDDNPKYAQFSPEELRVIVQEAARQGRIVSAHVHGKPAIIAVSLTISAYDLPEQIVLNVFQINASLHIFREGCMTPDQGL